MSLVSEDFRGLMAQRLRAGHAVVAARWLDRLAALLPVDANRVFPTDHLLDHIPELIVAIAPLRHPAFQPDCRVSPFEQRAGAESRTVDSWSLSFGPSLTDLVETTCEGHRHQRFRMSVSPHRSFRILLAVFCSIGILGIADVTPATWTLLVLVALSSAVLLPALLTGPSPIPVTLQPRAGVTR